MVSLRQLAVLLTIPSLQSSTRDALAKRAEALAAEVEGAIAQYGVCEHPTCGRVYAYEVDGYGNALFMDDANVPSLLSLPYVLPPHLLLQLHRFRPASVHRADDTKHVTMACCFHCLFCK